MLLPVLHGDLEGVKEMFKNDPSCLSERPDPNTTYFSLAVSLGHLEIAKFIHSKVPNQVHFWNSKRTLTPTYFAALNGDLEALKWLREVAPQQLFHLCNGETPFQVACLKGHLECVKFLLKCDSSQLQIGNVLENILSFDQVEVLEYLSKVSNILLVTPNENAFFRAGLAGAVKCLKFIAKKCPEQVTEKWQGLSAYERCQNIQNKFVLDLIASLSN